MVASAGAGPPPLNIATLTSDVLVNAIELLLRPETLEAAAVISQKMQRENGVQEAVKSFHRNLPVKTLCCDFIPSQAAVWHHKKGKRTFKLSQQAARILVGKGRIDQKTLKLYVFRSCLYFSDEQNPHNAGLTTKSAINQM